jgi:AP-3 complex subunit sigma
MIESILILNKQGVLRIVKIFTEDDGKIDIDDLAKRTYSNLIQSRDTNIISDFQYCEGKTRKLLYRQFGSIYIILIIDESENELGILDYVNLMMNVLENIFKGVTEMDIINYPEKVYYVLDEMISGGFVIETDKNEILSNYNEKMKD